MKDTDNNPLKESAFFSFNPLSPFQLQYFKEIFYTKVYEQGATVAEGDIVVDLGAGIGDFAFSIRNNKPKHIYCVEPDQSACELLEINTKGCPVTIIPKAIVGEKDIALNVLNDQGEWRYATAPDEVATTTLKNLIDECKIDYIDFLKIDIEGGEYNVFTEENMDFLTTKVKVIVCEFHIGSGPSSLREHFVYFRDTILPRFGKNAVTSVSYKDYSIKPTQLNYDIKSKGFEDNYMCATVWMYNKVGDYYKHAAKK